MLRIQNFVWLKLSMTIETDHLLSTVVHVHARWICSGGSEVMGLHVTCLVPFTGWMFISKWYYYYFGKGHSQSNTWHHLCEQQQGHFATQVRWNVINTPVLAGALSALFAKLWAVLCLCKTVMSRRTWYGF